MNKKERVKAAIRKEKVDYVPSCFSLHFPRETAFGEDAVKAHLEFYHATDTDILKVMNENLIPDIGPVETAADWEKLPAYDRSARFIRDQAELIRRLRDAEPDAYLLATVHGVCASMLHPMEASYGYDGGRENEAKLLRMHPASYLEAGKRVTETLCELVRVCAEAGCDGIYYAALGGEYRYYTDGQFAQAVRPFDREILEVSRETKCDVFLHICKDRLNMERYRSYAGLSDVVNWGVYEAPMSLEEGRKMFPDVAVMGGLANRSGVLVEGTEAEIRQAVRKVVDGFGRTGFILGADCTLPTEIPVWRIRAAVEAARE